MTVQLTAGEIYQFTIRVTQTSTRGGQPANVRLMGWCGAYDSNNNLLWQGQSFEYIDTPYGQPTNIVLNSGYFTPTAGQSSSGRLDLAVIPYAWNPQTQKWSQGQWLGRTSVPYVSAYIPTHAIDMNITGAVYIPWSNYERYRAARVTVNIHNLTNYTITRILTMHCRWLNWGDRPDQGDTEITLSPNETRTITIDSNSQINYNSSTDGWMTPVIWFTDENGNASNEFTMGYPDGGGSEEPELFTLSKQIYPYPGVSGYISTDPLGETFAYGTVVYVRAVPLNGYIFENWELNGQYFDQPNPFNLLVVNSQTLTARFRLP